MFNTALIHTSEPSYDIDARPHFARLSNVDLKLKKDINNLIVKLKTDGVWTKLDDLYVIHKNKADSLLGLKGFKDSVAVDAGTSTVTYNAALGLNTNNNGSGNIAYINTQIKDTGIENMSLDNMSQFFYRTARVNLAVGVLGAMGAWTTVSGNILSIQIASDIQSAMLAGQDTTVSPVLATSAGVGFYGGTRTANNAVELRHDAETVTDALLSDAGPADADIFVGGLNLNGLPLQSVGSQDFAAWGVGGGLTSIELSNLRDAIQTYMTARGL